MINASLRPELEYDLFKEVLLREQKVERLRKTLQNDLTKHIESQVAIARATNTKKKIKGAKIPAVVPLRVNVGLIGLLDTLRESTVSVVLKTREWEFTQLSYPNVVSYKWNGENYMEKILHDLDFLQDHTYLVNWLGFSPVRNPFLVPPELLREELNVPPKSIISFGIPPPQPVGFFKGKAITGKFVKSPYVTPIINDPEVFVHLAARNQLNSQFKKISKTGDAQSAETDEQEEEAEKSGALYRSYLNSDQILQLRKCWKLLQRVSATSTDAATRIPSAALLQDGEGGDMVPGGGLEVGPSQSLVQSYESRAFDSPSAAELPSRDGPTGSASELKGLNAASTQTLSGAPSGSSSPSKQQHDAFQGSKQYFQRSLHDTSGALYVTQDASNPSLRHFAVGQVPVDAVEGASYSVVPQPTLQTSAGGAPAEGAAEVVLVTPGLEVFAEDSAEMVWGSASQAETTMRVQGVRGVHPNTTTGVLRTDAGGQREIGQDLNTTSSQLWTPHEIHLQRQVQRRGGELYVLTAAGTQGRMKAPWRRTRFERLEDDVLHLHEQSTMLHMAVEEALTRAVNKAIVVAEEEEALSSAAPVVEAERRASVTSTGSGTPRVRFARSQDAAVEQQQANAAPSPVLTPAAAGFKRARAGGPGILPQRSPPAYTPGTPSTGRPVPSRPGSAAAATARLAELKRLHGSPPVTRPASPGSYRPQGISPTRPLSAGGARAGGATVSGWSDAPRSSGPVRPMSAGPAQGLVGSRDSPTPAPTARPGSAPGMPTTSPLLGTSRRSPAVPPHSPSAAGEVSSPSVALGEGVASPADTDAEAGTDEEQSDEDAQQSPSAPQQQQPTPVLETVKPTALVYKVDAATADAVRELKLRSIEVDRRRAFLQYQYDHFKLVSTGNLTDLTKQRRLHRMKEGETLEEDQAVAMGLEDAMAHKIQRRIRRKFGRALRQALLRKMNAAAKRIQGVWRRCKVHMLSLQRGAQLRLALILQRLYRGGSVNDTMRRLKREALERVASKTLQRVFRGYLGRRRLSLKREFVGCLTQASMHVSIKELTPGHVEELADMLDMFVRDYTIDLPVAVLTVLRAVFYTFNGDNSECVVVSKDGYIEKKYIRAANATWQGAKLILRRKSRFLRRLRALVANSCLPNPSKFNFTVDALCQLQAVVDSITPADFEDVAVGQHCLLKLLQYCRCLHRAHQLQDLFPEYFDPGLSAWFRYLMNIRQKYDRADLLRRIQSKCKFRLESQRRQYTREGRSWRHVADATKRNEFDLEEARLLRTKCKKRCEAYLQELRAAELKKVTTLEGIVRAKALSVQVAQGDLKEYVQAVVIPDEARLRELYYAVDTRSLSLLQSKAEIVKTLELNERNEQSRDFDKIMKTKRLHEICGDLGAVLADLMVLLNNWKSLLAAIGGFQYVKDLVGHRKAYYEHIRTSSLALMKRRRALLEAFESDLQQQYDKVIQVAYDLGAKACNAYWDSPTAVEVEAEAEENRECCRREADFELRLRRQTEHVHIAPAPFVPVLLLIDSRLPRKLRSYLTENLQRFDFEVCGVPQTDEKLVLEMQRIIDKKMHVLFFANRGAHSLARLTFLSSFNSVVSGLIPTPHIVALDCTLALRVEDWHTMFAVEQTGMTNFNVGDSANCDLSLGKLRNLASLFRECLVHAEGDDYESASESEEEEQEERTFVRRKSSATSMSRVSFASVGSAPQSEGNPATDAAAAVPDAAAAATSCATVHVAPAEASSPPAPRTRSVSVTFHSDVSAALQSVAPSEEPRSQSRPQRRRLDALHVPPFVRRLFMADFHSFVTHIAQKLPSVSPDTVRELQVRCKPPVALDRVGRRRSSSAGSTGSATKETSITASSTQPPLLTNEFLYSDMVLAATLSTILNLWQAPLTEWTDRDIAKGSNAFRKKCLRLSYNELCEVLEMREFAESSVIACKRLDRAMALKEAWTVLRKHDFYVHPARNILARWTWEIVELMNRFSTQGGRADENFRNCNAASVRQLRWRDDILDPDNAGVQLLGDLLHACLTKALIYEDKHCLVKYFYDRGDIHSTERKCIDSFATPQHVRVYHSNEETFVGVSVDSSRLLRNQSAPSWKFFSRMRVRDLITMLQPNFTEIVEGKVKKFNIKPGGTHKWYQLLAQWASLDNISDKFQITLLRSRYLVLSKLGMVKGYMVRMEIFEERFGEVRILVYGVHDNAVSFLVDRKRVYDLLNYCDVHAEKDKLDALDTQSIAYIFSDRLEVRPSKMWQHFLSHGELLPKALDRPVQLHLRKRQGPGRFTGRRVLMVGKVRVIITLFELDSDTNSHELRIVLYETRHCQTAEYRLSAMERLMLFQDDTPMLEQICARLRHVYCDITDKSRTLIVLDDSDVPALDSSFEVDGDDEYDVRSQVSDFESEDEEGEEGAPDSDEELDEDDAATRDSSKEGTPGPPDPTWSPSPPSRRRGSHMSGRRNSTSGKKNRRRGSQMSRTSRLSSLAQRPPSGWGWAIYLNRAIVTEQKGNLKIAVTVSVPQRGFVFTVFDPRTHREGYRLISFHDACALSADKTLEALEEDLGNMDESTAYDLADEFMGLVEVVNSDDDQLAVVLSGEETEQESLVIARLGEFRPPRFEARSVKKPTIPVQRVTVFVHGAKELERIGAFGTRNPVCIVKWNYREVGRTKIARSTLAPRWSNASFLVLTPKNKELQDCSLDLELFDTSADGKNKLTDFLGCIKIAGANLVEFLEAERPHWVECEKAKRLHGEENRHAKGFIEVSGTRRDVTISSAETVAAEAEPAQGSGKEAVKGGFGVSARFGAQWFGTSSKQIGAGAETSAVAMTAVAGGSSKSVAAESTSLAAPLLGELSKKLVTRAQLSGSFVAPILEEQEEENVAPAPPAVTPSGTSRRLSGASIKWKVEDDAAAAVSPPPLDATIADGLCSSSATTTPLYLGVLGAEGLPSGVEITCTAKFNGFAVQSLTATSTEDNYMAAKVAFLDGPTQLGIPPGLPLAACELQLCLSRADSHHNTVPLAELTLRGSALVQFLRRGSCSLEATRVLPAGPQSGAGFGAAVGGLLGHSAVPTATGAEALRPCKLQLVGSYQPIKQESYRLQVVSARNLPKADVFGSSDPFVKLLLDGRLVGQTAVVSNSVSPHWDETFTFTLPLLASILDSALVLEAYSRDKADRLGSCTVTGAALQELLAPKSAGTAEGVTLALQREQRVRGKTQVLDCGEITLLGCGAVVAESSVNTGPLHAPAAAAALEDQAAVEMEQSSAQKLVEEAYEELHNSAADVFLFNVRMARGLVTADALKHSHTFVNVYFNGEFIGKTPEIAHAAVIDWGARPAGSAAQSSELRLEVPRGQPLSACRLELELVAAEHHTQIGMHMTTTSTSTVLGGRVISGDELVALARGPQSVGAEADSTRRSVGPGGVQYFPLATSVRPAPATATKTGPAPAVAPQAPEPPAAGLRALGASLSFKSKEKPKPRAPALDAAGMAAVANAAAAAEATEHAALPYNRTPQGELGFTLRPAAGTDTGAEGTSNALASGVKNIVVEEPELLREHSTLQLSLGAVQGIARSVQALKKCRTPLKTETLGIPNTTTALPTSPHAPAPDPAVGAPAVAALQTVDVVVRWNGVRVQTYLGMANLSSGAFSWPQDPSLVLRLPFSLDIADCHLEVQLWHQRALLGSVAYWGAALAKLAGIEQGLSTEAEGQGTGEDGQLAHGRSEAASIVTEGEPQWRSLHPSAAIPTSLHAPVVTGQIQLSARLTQPLLRKKSSVSYRDPNRKRTFFRTIATDLAAEKRHWAHAFVDADAAEVDPDGDHFDPTATLDRGSPSRRGSQVYTTPDVRHRKRLMSDISKQSSMPDDDSRSNLVSGVAAEDTALGRTAPALDAPGLGLLGERAKFQKLRLELAAVSFTVTVHQEVDEHRVCWRGRVMPKNFSGSEGTRIAMMVTRASRLVRTRGIADMQVMAEVHQLADTGEEQEAVNDLPICVKEVLTDGPGLIQRTYRVEIAANNGVMMGFADIKDEVVDLERVVGKEHISRLLPDERKLWKLGAIFQHVVRERIVLDMLHSKGKTTGKEGRREGIMQQHDELAELTGSIISVMRDPSAEELALAARAEREAEEAAAAAAKAAEDAAVAASSGLGFGLGLNINLGLKGFKFGFGKTKAAEAVTADIVPAEDDGTVEHANTNETIRGSTMGAYSTHTHSVMGEDSTDDIGVSHKEGRQWLRIHARTHRVVGKPLRSVVLLLTTPHTDALYQSNPDRYFRTVHGRDCLLQFDVLIRCKDSFTKETRELLLTAAEVGAWLPPSQPVDLTTRFRRDKLGAFLLQYVSVRFTEEGRVGLYLIREEESAISSMDDLLGEDDQPQQQEEE